MAITGIDYLRFQVKNLEEKAERMKANVVLCQKELKKAEEDLAEAVAQREEFESAIKVLELVEQKAA